MNRVFLVLAAVGLLAIPVHASTTPAAVPDSSGVRVLPSGGLRGESAALALKGQQGGSLQFELLALPVALDAQPGVPVLIEVLGSDLIENATGFARAEVAVYALSDEGVLGASLLRVVEVDLTRKGAELAAGGLKLVARLPLGAGRWTLRAFVRSLAPNGRVSLRVQPLVIESDPAFATVSPPVILQDPAHWVVASLDKGGAEWLAEGTPLPAARPIVGAGAQLDAVVAVRHLNPRARLEVRVVGADGEEVAIRLLERSRRERTRSVGVELVHGQIDLAGLPEGELQLQTMAHTPQDLNVGSGLAGTPGASFGSTGLPVSVAGGALPAHVATWAEAFGGATTQLAVEELDEASSRSSRLAIPRDEVDSGLRDAFALLATGRPLEARLALTELETRALGGSGGAVSTLAKAELTLCRDLAKQDPESLVPLALLWLDIYRAERARKSFLLSTHARGMVSAVADLYVEAASGEGTKRLASRIHAVLGAELQDAGLTRLAGAALDRALVLDPGADLPALALATELEKRGATADMLKRLETLVTAQPSHREGRLRLAMAELRVGRTRAARERLNGLLDADAPADWVLALAAQELLRLDLAAKRYDDAEATARRGLERLPGNEKLILGLAAISDLRGRPREARAHLELIERSDASGAGERARYGEPPREALGRVEREVRESAAPRLDRLAASLGLSRSESQAAPRAVAAS